MADTSDRVISDSDWRRVTKDGAGVSLRFPGPFDDAERTDLIRVSGAWALQAIALANHALPAEDTHKITPNMIEQLRRAAQDLSAQLAHIEPRADLTAIANALESYLPSA